MPDYTNGNNQAFYILSYSFIALIAIARIILCLSFSKAKNKYYFYLENRLLVKANLDPEVVEKRRNSRVEKNIAKKREEKGLVTVVESVNETDPNRTQAPNQLHNAGSREAHNKTKFQPREGTVIQEDEEERENPDDNILGGSDYGTITSGSVRRG